MFRFVGLLVLLLLLAAPARAEEPRGPLLGASAPSQGVGARRLALCIGIDGYRHPVYPALRYAAADARLLAKTFEGLGYEVTLMVDGDPDLDPALVPTRRNLDEAIHAFCRSSIRPGDTLIVCFAGHGDVVAGQSVLIPLDYHETDRAITVGSLFDALRRAKASKKLLVLDACRSARRDATRTLQSGFLLALGQAENAVVLSGCGVDQSSYEDEELGHGRLTSCLVEGLGGAAFGPDREFLFGHELWGWVERNFHDRKWAQQQSPTMFGIWDSRVRFDIARRDVEPPPPITSEDREVFDLTMQKAVASSMAADHTRAVKYCTTALRVLPRHPDALARRSYAYLGLGYRDKAFQDAQAALEQDEDHPVALVIRVWLALVAQNVELALAEVERMRAAFDRAPQRMRNEIPPDVAGAFWTMFGAMMSTMGAGEDSELQGYAWALETEGAPPAVKAQAYLNRGILHTRKTRFPDAISDFTSIIEMEGAPGSQVAYAYFNRAWLRATQGTSDQGRADYEAALAQEGADEDLTYQARWNLAMMDRMSGDEASARRRYQQPLSDPDLPVRQRAWIGLDYGRMLTGVNDYRAARVALQEVVGLRGAPEDPVARAYGNLGGIDLHLRGFESALRRLDRCLESAAPPAFIDARMLNQRGTVLEALGRPADAAASYDGVLALADAPLSEHTEARLRGAILAHRLGRADKALALLDEIFDPDLLLFEPRRIALALRALIHAEAMRGEAARAALAKAEGARFAADAALALAWLDQARAVALLGRPVEPAAQALAGTPALAAPGAAGWLDGLGAVGRRDWGEAVALLRRAAETAHPPVSVLWALSEYSMRTAEPPETAALYVWARGLYREPELRRDDVDAWAEANPDHPVARLLR